ncbi:DEAD/DEAH box helicase [Saccharophagus degradans]|uniref:DEAD/DEAH box helicase n=1 Tax=Saccharophagus degradans TaxID=86304 RepID=UPI002477E6A5|nr:DEAD/DEAH box helicase [Saccharophagus degradans]WGO96555.1 DEAD/DEAH box helicase [Saccharophagus degradans]
MEKALTYREKSDLNKRLLDILSLQLTDKESPIIPWPGKRYYHEHPSNLSLAGSIASPPDPAFPGPQPPNSMGMVLLAEPNTDGVFNLVVSGQFDIVHRCIPEIEVVRRELKHDGDTAKPTQPIVTCYRRLTVTFKNVSIILETNDGRKDWVRPQEGNDLENALAAVAVQCRADPEIFKRCHASDRGYAIVDFPWDNAITTQTVLNTVVARHIFEDLKEVLPYDVRLRARARRAPPSLASQPNAYLVEVFLENTTDQTVARRFGLPRSAHILDVRFSCALKAGTAYRLPHKLTPADYRHKDHGSVPGYGITAGVELDPEGVFHTTSMPISQQAKTQNPSHQALGMESDAHFLALSDNPLPLLNDFKVALEHYANDWDGVIAALKDSSDNASARIAEQDKAAYLREIASIKDGIDLLSRHAHLRQAFQWMNEVMHKAFEHQEKNITTWRLFQLGFILTQVRAVYERCCDQKEITDHTQIAEVLWFATGGGKTEAYLGILVMSMFFERRNHRLYGPTAWMKFPLRMLSVQQFQRLAYVIAQANKLKQRESLEGHPFTIGYFTGEGTPSSISSDYESASSGYLPKADVKKMTTWQFIQDCPYCKAENSVVMRKDYERARLLHVCTNSDCWTHVQADLGHYGEGIRGEIGIYVSDEEVYRYQPTVMVGTTDKLAVLGHNRRFRLFFGGATHFCPEHGFNFEGKCQHSRIRQKNDGTYESVPCGNSTRSSLRTQALGPAVFPGIQFILQDELHLLSQNTGNFNSHYETTMQAIQIANGGRPSKFLSATATIQGFEDHVNHLYQRHARRFPVPGHKRGESFYSRIHEDNDGPLVQRWYAGIMPLGSGRIVERASAIASMRFLTIVDDLRQKLSETPDETSRQLGFSTENAPALTRHIETFLNTCLIYNNSIRGNGELHSALETHQRNHPERVWKKLDGSTSLNEILETIRLIETKAPDCQTRQIIATSLISHGVDMHRLNFMIVSGWPKSIAEYMQSSARSGRIEPGIVLSVLDSRQLFQTNVFLEFQDYHRFLDRMVESVPINRFAPNLLERTLPGALNACVLNWMEGHRWGAKAGQNGVNLRNILSQSENGAERMLRDMLVDCLSVPAAIKGQFDARVVRDYEDMVHNAIDRAINLLLHLPADLSAESVSNALGRLLGYPPMRSFRDIESQIPVKPATDTSRLIEALGHR